MEIDNGEKILFWLQKRFLNRPHTAAAGANIPPDLVDSTMTNMWDENLICGITTWSLFESNSSYNLFLREDNHDALGWGGMSSGNLTIDSVLSIIWEDIVEEPDNVWELMWRLQALQQVYFGYINGF